LVDNLCFGGNVPFLTCLSIVEIEIPRSYDTSLIVRKGRLFGFVMVGKWWGNISKSQISYVIFIHTPSGNITLTTARGVYKFQKVILSHPQGWLFLFDLFFVK